MIMSDSISYVMYSYVRCRDDAGEKTYREYEEELDEHSSKRQNTSYQGPA